jgi:hypothetical protein
MWDLKIWVWVLALHFWRHEQNQFSWKISEKNSSKFNNVPYVQFYCMEKLNLVWFNLIASIQWINTNWQPNAQKDIISNKMQHTLPILAQASHPLAQVKQVNQSSGSAYHTVKVLDLLQLISSININVCLQNPLKMPTWE